MLERNPDVAKKAVISSMPMGAAPEDFELVRTLHAEDKLCVHEQEDEAQEPRIICSLGLFPTSGGD